MNSNGYNSMFRTRCAVVDSLEHILSKTLETSTVQRCNVENEGYCSEGGFGISASPYSWVKEPRRTYPFSAAVRYTIGSVFVFKEDNITLCRILKLKVIYRNKKAIAKCNGVGFRERNYSGYRYTLRHIRPYLRTLVGY